MPLIIKGGNGPTIISKTAMKNRLGQLIEDKINDDPLSHLSPEIAEKRKEILDAKRHREFMARIEKQEADAMRKLKEAKVEVTSEILVDNTATTTITHNDVVTISTKEKATEVPDFEAMTKREIDEWAESVLGLTLDRRKKKADLIETIRKSL
ncbi:hypothetical protein N9R43_01600 [bacterium]|nr:hypothetical protein [bacterium]